MSDDLLIKLKDDTGEMQEYPLDVEETLANLTGLETAEVEEFLGGFEYFDPRSGNARSVIVTIWLAKKQAGENATLNDVGQLKGLIFGDRFDVEELNGGPPAPGADAPSSPDEQPGTELTSDDSGAGS